MVDGNGDAIVGAVLRVSLEDSDAGTISSGSESGTELDLVTDSEGLVSVDWTLGSEGGEFDLTFASTSLDLSDTVSATAQAPTTLSQSGTGTTTLGVTVLDQNGAAIEGVTVEFESDGDGALSIDGSGADNPVSGTTDEAGLVEAEWTVGESGTEVTARLPNFSGISSVTFAAPE